MSNHYPDHLKVESAKNSDLAPFFWRLSLDETLSEIKVPLAVHVGKFTVN